ncbi:dihydrofolate reductase-like [Amphiura filiformis]|uniref:dihydrofolate reductase-like n=1 Tax=Amphiura filiformis TaxID=82378 RepID=UPI003B215F9B
MACEKPVHLIVAVSRNGMGIGKNGNLPWRLRKDMKYFAEMTSKTKLDSKQNAVIMGRKTWDSIPEKFRPLPNRVNVILSKSLAEKPAGAHHLCTSLEDALNVVSKSSTGDNVESIWIIGGGAVYKEAVNKSLCNRIYLTRVLADFDCDTFFPEFDTKLYQLIVDPEVNGEVQEEKGIEFKYEIYERS